MGAIRIFCNHWLILVKQHGFIAAHRNHLEMHTIPKFLAAEIRFEFDGEVGVCRVYADGSKDVSLGGTSFQYEAAGAKIRAAITRASTLAVFT